MIPNRPNVHCMGCKLDLGPPPEIPPQLQALAKKLGGDINVLTQVIFCGACALALSKRAAPLMPRVDPSVN